jgi:hypothetical protein
MGPIFTSLAISLRVVKQQDLISILISRLMVVVMTLLGTLEILATSLVISAASLKLASKTG